jgi:hypothetical protein
LNTGNQRKYLNSHIFKVSYLILLRRIIYKMEIKKTGNTQKLEIFGATKSTRDFVGFLISTSEGGRD